MNNTDTDIANIMNTPEFQGSFKYLWHDGWRVALPFEYIIYSIIVGTMIKVLLQYLMWKYMKSTINSLLWIPSIVLTLPSFILLYGLFSNKPLFIYIILPIIIEMELNISESFLKKGISKFNWIRTDIV